MLEQLQSKLNETNQLIRTTKGLRWIERYAFFPELLKEKKELEQKIESLQAEARQAI